MTTEPSPLCQRCGGALGAEPSILDIQAGRLHADGPALALCPKCTDSFEHWLARRRSGRPQDRSKSSGGARERSSSSKEDGRHRSRGGDDQFRLLMGLAAIAIIGLLLALVMVLLFRH